MNNYPKPSFHQTRRLKGWDYTRPGAYFITICVANRRCIFGEINKSKMLLNEFGFIARDTWMWLSSQYPYIQLDEYQIIPNHFHGILWIKDKNFLVLNIQNRGGGSRTALPEQQKIISEKNITINRIKPVGRLIGAFKTVSTKQINLIRQTPGVSLWQRDFYDHIGRNEKELYRYRKYIKNNPVNWDSDDENPFGKSPRYVAMNNPQKY